MTAKKKPARAKRQRGLPPLKLTDLPHEALAPQPMPTKTVVANDYDALFQRMVDNGGWYVLRTDPEEDRPLMSRAGKLTTMESPLVKGINNHVRMVVKRPLYTRRLARDAWYLELGAEKDFDQEGESNEQTH